MDKMVWEQGMNPEQLQAINHQDGPVALMAVAGAGKTRALVHRIARMVAQGTPAGAILAVTFSTKAAEEMNTRLAALQVEGARVGTWHSLCLQIIRQDETEWSGWAVDDKNRAPLVLKEVVGYKHMNWRDADVTALGSYIGRCKANLFDPGTTEARELALNEFDMSHAGRAAEAYELYQRLVEERGILTFDDFLVFAHRHLSTSEDARLRWAGRWSYLLVDEAQDNNLAQVRLQELLARDHRNIMVVGDVAQSIYGFRGSTPQYLADFAKEWSAPTIIMNRNYRSGAAVIATANAVIKPAAVRLPVDMLAERGTPGSVAVHCAADLDAEAEHFASWVYELTESGKHLSSIAALFRTNAQSRALEEALLGKRIPYVVVGGTSFYERKEVKDVLGYLRVAAGRDKEGDAVRRCLNAPFRYLGAAFLDRLTDALPKRATWQQAVAAADRVATQAGIQRRQRDSVAAWGAIVEQVAVAIDKGEKPDQVVNDLVHRTGYIAWLTKEEGEESVENSRVSNVRELARVAARFATVRELLDYIDETVSAARRQREDKQAGGERVLLMSVHRSKGLEWPHVFVGGCNEMVLPHARGDIEEERRLMYVAVTRARDALVLSYVQRFATPVGVKDAHPSRFLVDAGLVKPATGAVAP